MSIEYKAAAVAGVDVIDEEKGIVRALVSVTGIQDRVKDVILPGAYEKTLQARKPKGVWSHAWDKPIAKTLEVRELMPGDKDLPKQLPNGNPWPKEAGGLWVKTQFNLDGERGKQAFADVKFFGTDQEWSIGYQVPPGEATIKKGLRHIRSLDLFEYSPVLFGAMPNARTYESVKDAQDAWTEVKSAIWGTCGDGEGTCCTSCGTEKKDDHHDDLYVIDFPDGAPGELPETVGPFATKTAAYAWLDALDEESVQSYVHPMVEEVKSEVIDEDDYEAMMAAVAELKGEEAPKKKDKSKAKETMASAAADLENGKNPEAAKERMAEAGRALAGVVKKTPDGEIDPAAAGVEVNEDGTVALPDPDDIDALLDADLNEMDIDSPEFRKFLRAILDADEDGNGIPDVVEVAKESHEAAAKLWEGLSLEQKEAVIEDEDDLPTDEEIQKEIEAWYASIFGSTPEEKRAFTEQLHPRGSDGKFTERGGGNVPSVPNAPSLSRREQRKAKRADKKKARTIKRAKRVHDQYLRESVAFEQLMAESQGRKPSGATAAVVASLSTAIRFGGDRQADFITNDLGVDFPDLVSQVKKDFETNGASPGVKLDMHAAMDDILKDFNADLKGKKSDEVDVETKEDWESWDEEHVFDLMSKMDPETLELLINAVETEDWEGKTWDDDAAGDEVSDDEEDGSVGTEEKAAPVAEATGGRGVGKGKGNIKPIMHWFERGEGAAKIRWGTKGDFNRCVRLASKHMTPENAKGFCNKRHQAVTGHAPGQGPHVGVPHKGKKGYTLDSEGKLMPMDGNTISHWENVTVLEAFIDGATKTLESYLDDGVDLYDFDEKGLRHFVESLFRRDEDGKFTEKNGSSDSGGKETSGSPAKSKGKKPPTWDAMFEELDELASDRDSILHYMVDRGLAKRQQDSGIQVDAHYGDQHMFGKFDAPRIRLVGKLAKQLAAKKIAGRQNFNLNTGQATYIIDGKSVTVDLVDGQIVKKKPKELTIVAGKEDEVEVETKSDESVTLNADEVFALHGVVDILRVDC